jgi:hypothetical protein
MRGIATRSGTLLALALLIAVTAAGGSAATTRHSRILGVVPHAGQLAATPHLLALSKAGKAAGPALLTFDASYENLINQYFTDVGHDSSGASNVYSVATQYYDNPGTVHIQYQSTFGGSYVDNHPLPKNGCDDGIDTYCLTDAQIQHEIQTVLTAKGWPAGLNHIFFLMTPNGVGSCSDALSFECSTDSFCAYHSFFVDSNNEDVIYANEPYEGPQGGCTDVSQGYPNDANSDTTINTISHEHNEAITDPLGNGWYSNDANQDENGDLCAYGFGSPVGGTPGIDAYNQVINGHHYDLQQEYSNADAGCVQHPGGTPATPPTTGTGPLVYNGGPVMRTSTAYAIYWLPSARNSKAPHISGRARIGKKLSGGHGTWNSAVTFRYQWLRCNAHGGRCSSIPYATHLTYKLTSHDAGHRVRLRVTATNANGSTVAVSTASARVTH